MQIIKQHKLNVLFSILLLFALAFPVITSAQTTLAAIPTTQPTQAPSLQLNEVSQYQNQTLTPINTYIGYLKSHPDVAIKGVQTLNQSTYQLAMTGLVNNPANYSYTDIVDGSNSTLQVATLPCVEGWSVTMLWQGVPITELLQKAGGISPVANTVIFIAADGYSSSLPLDYIKENNIMIAYKMNNVTLTPQLGWPFFLVAKSQYGYKWVEWITEINVSNNTNYLGYWESRGYPNNATVRDTQSPAQSGASFVFSVVVASVIGVAAAAYGVVQVRCRIKSRLRVQKCTNKP